ncbi:Wadjet anti-phage system protein JetA family protein [Teredinibacter sp. KSP-S5-2]|uniref:Wadjet anti-phage system protein JetA family protein n=1 Tax=Teredinibacter sp. KSP-S5-2 TaxID=3034506 RepID=UPI0029343157|nr:Wadjet anti-phage system protein JetA family protein [Teredinibacter sp. KSP-S5-2]WNO10826.1 DUF5716 family protein [Teredinibacter sp. KSP-S5-2]
MFFSSERRDFFKPLTSKYREQIVQCLRLLYQRLYSVQADYGHILSKDQILDIFDEALVRAPVLETEDGEEASQRFKSNREQSSWILKQLLECGWLIKQVDPATLQSTYPFTRMGRVFTQSLVESDATQIRTRHRNTRNTLNALEAFISRGEVYDLLDAYEYSERIVTDFTDVIAELDERKRQLVQEVEAQQLVQQATDQFFEFMEKRFQPDVSVRLSADSVEKHRDQISKTITRIRRKPKEFKAQVERQLRQQVPDLVEDKSRSVLWQILDTIDQRMTNAAEVMLPALRNALHGFTKRADIIIRQLSYLSVQQADDVVALCQVLRSLPEEEQNRRLEEASGNLAGMRLQWVDPAQIKLYERRRVRTVTTAVQESVSIDEDARREQMIQQFLDQAFIMDNKTLKAYVADALKNKGVVSTADLPVNTAHDLLAMAHAIEVGAVNNLSSDHHFVVRWNERQIETDFYKKVDEFLIEIKN